MEADSDRKRMVNPRKCYPIDCALIPLYDRTGRANLGHALETATLIELVRRRCYVSYVKSSSGFEVDFLARYPGQAPELIQVCADPSPPETLARETRALMDARVLVPGATATLLTLNRFVGPLPAGVRCLPFHEWCQGAAE
jgi:predicted AAA+ superfamily ATPase